MRRVFALALALTWLLVPAAARATCTAYQTVVTNDSPTYYWRLNEDSKADSSTATDTQGANNLTYHTSGIGTVTGPITNTVDTDSADWGTGDNGRYATSATSFSMSGSWTIELWIKAYDWTSAYVIDHGDSPAVITQYGYNGIWLYSGVSGCETASKIPLTDTASWHYVVWTWNDSTDVMTSYLDGTQNATGSSLDCNHGNTVVYLGNFRTTGGGGDYHGKMDEVAYYLGTALSSTQVADHYAAATCADVTATPTFTATATPTSTPTSTPTDTPTDTPTSGPSNTPTNTPIVCWGDCDGDGIPEGDEYNYCGTFYSLPAPEDCRLCDATGGTISTGDLNLIAAAAGATPACITATPTSTPTHTPTATGTSTSTPTPTTTPTPTSARNRRVPIIL